MILDLNVTLYINIFLIVLIVGALIFGYIYGFLWQVVKIAGYIAVALIAFIVAPGLADLIDVFPKKLAPFANSDLANVFYSKINTICWFAIIVVVGIIIILIIKPITKAITQIKLVKAVDKILGCLLALLPTTIIILGLTYILSTAAFRNGEEIIDNSGLKYAKVIVNKVSTYASDTLKENSALQKLINNPLSLKSDDINYIVDWLKNANVSASDIKTFFEKYGIKVPEKIVEESSYNEG